MTLKTAPKRTRQSGFTIIEILVTMICVVVVTAGLVKFLNTSTKEQSAQEKNARFNMEMRRVKSQISDYIKKATQSQNNRRYGLLLGDDGYTSPQTLVTIKANNERNGEQVYLDSLTIIKRSSDKGTGMFQLAQDFSPSSTVVRVRKSDVAVPSFVQRDLLMITTESQLGLYAVAPGTTATKLSETVYEFSISQNPYNVFALPDSASTMVNLYKHSNNGDHKFNDTTTMDDFKSNDAFIQKVEIVKFYCAPASDGYVYLYKTTNLNIPKYTSLVSTAKLASCDFKYYLTSDPSTPVDHIGTPFDASFVESIEFRFESASTDTVIADGARIGLGGLADFNLAATNTDRNVQPHTAVSSGESFTVGQTLIMTNFAGATEPKYLQLYNYRDSATNQVKGNIKGSNYDGSDIAFTNASVLESDIPYTVGTQVGDHYVVFKAAQADVDSSDGEVGLGGGGLAIFANSSGEITANLAVDTFELGLNSVTAAYVTEISGTYHAWLYSNDTFAASGNPLIVHYKVDMPDMTSANPQMDFEVVQTYEAAFSNSKVVTAITMIPEFTEEGAAALVVSTTQATDYATNEKLNGGIFMVPVDGTTMEPFETSADRVATGNPLTPEPISGVRFSTVVNGFFGGVGPVISKTTGDPTQFVFNLYNNQMITTQGALSELALEIITGARDAFWLHSTLQANGGETRACGNRIPSYMMSDSYQQANPGQDYDMVGHMSGANTQYTDFSLENNANTLIAAALAENGHTFSAEMNTTAVAAYNLNGSINTDSTGKAMKSMIMTTQTYNEIEHAREGEMDMFSMVFPSNPIEPCTPFIPITADMDESTANDLFPFAKFEDSSGNPYNIVVGADGFYYVDVSGSTSTLNLTTLASTTGSTLTQTSTVNTSGPKWTKVATSSVYSPSPMTSFSFGP